MGTPVEIKPLKSFDEFNDYISDVAWSPLHPAIFGSVDASGNVHIFNLNLHESPLMTITNTVDVGYNKMGWSENGNYLAAATFDGSIDVYDVEKANNWLKLRLSS
jgi:dynein intermediate chain